MSGWRQTRGQSIAEARAILSRLWAKMEVYDAPPYDPLDLYRFLWEAEPMATMEDRDRARAAMMAMRRMDKRDKQEGRDNG